MRNHARIITVLLLAISFNGMAQTVTEKDTVCRTYPFGDPDPVPHKSNIYPYFRYDSYSFTPVDKHWKMVVLENDFLRVRIFPEIGGKIWSIVDKKTGKEMFYDNDVIKFRDISLRGPWTSGGIEFNFGIIGHAPSCAAPVNYQLSKNPDGSVSCFIGVFEMLSRTTWTVEINLPKDKGWLLTRTFWHNGSGSFQPYYTWFNSGVKATEDLEIIYPASYSIAHWGQVDEYPVDHTVGKDLSKYSQLDFGVDKSFHPGGSQRGYFGAYYQSEDFGMMHMADRDQKIGRKFFSWAKSGQGDIWRELLTDNKGQYVELQSGRLLNQNLYESLFTPYKQFLFTPFGTDRYSEYWFPFSSIGEVGDVSYNGAVNVALTGNSMKLDFYPLENTKGKMSVLDGQGKELASSDVDVKVAEPFHRTFELASDSKPSRILLVGREIWTSDTKELDRPNAIPKGYDRETAECQYEYGKYCAGMRNYVQAETYVDSSLALDPNFIPSLDLKAMLLLRKGNFQGAFDYGSRSLSIDQYDPQGNYVSAQAAECLGKVYDALDRYEVAAITPELRSASCTQISRIYYAKGEYERAAAYAERSVVGNAYNISGMEMQYLCASALGCEYGKYLEQIGKLDPLNHFIGFERYLRGDITKSQLADGIKEEMRWQDYLEAAVGYHGIGEDAKAARLLEACPEPNALTAIWAAYLKKDASAIKDAETLGIDFVFPFRVESLEPLKWSMENGGGWKSRYLISSLYGYLGDSKEALDMVKGLDDVTYAPFYAYRFDLSNDPEDIKTAIRLDPEQWRYANRLGQYYIAANRCNDALAVLAPFYKSHKDNFHIGDTYLKTLIKSGQYEKANSVLKEIRILPFEGQSGSRVMYRDVKLHLAAAAADRHQYSKALGYLEEARQWPHNLGVGKPYDDLIDSRMEDWMSAVVCSRLGKSSEAAAYLSAIKDPDGSWKDSFVRATAQKNGKYPEISPMLGNLDSSFDKRMF
jgi:tetratricopeptide (TPR) repeat protein